MTTGAVPQMLTGAALFSQVAAEAGEAFWWLGQHSFVLKLAGLPILLDPFLTPLPERRVPPLFAPGDARDVAVVCCTHDHLDHLDPWAVEGLAQTSQAVFVASRAHRDRLLSLGVPTDRLRLVDDGLTVTIGGLKITGIKAAHEFFDQTPAGYFPHLGLVLEGNGKVVYHAGDTLWWEGLQHRLAQWQFDVAIVPINGRDAVRYSQNIQGNMTYQEAADLLGGLRVQLAVPAHYDMFLQNSISPQLFVDYVTVKYPGQRMWVGAPTERVPF